MLLAVAVENSRTLVGLVFEGAVKRHWWVGTDPRRTADEWAVLLGGLLAGEAPVAGIAVCSAVPHVLHELRDVVARYYADLPSVVLEPGVKTGLPVLVDNPREVGTDRIANALAAVNRHGSPCVVVDIGTATTVDLVNPAGAFVGGAIAPGIETATDALGEAAAQLRRVELVRPRAALAKNTVEALQSGAIFGFTALVDGLVTRILIEQSLAPGSVPVVATGALAALIVPESTLITHHEPFLPLLGLHQAFARNH
ncbi:putative transcriptional acitvator, Baf family [Kribbella flavida DSM 17836]|uniref:Type III pantothenate kinase n=1 Tax=Kribbella flavida (strain DSM 17836 / JCM 10339 / NBRC 14399) TaxID=479435 RepID=D2PY73_KRIFD|nr:type III pantothenate kinase [Kribbella flavida]ADB35441.1 putative transcriptional acitvator, Baf family [Kribbella flavida DSM 17836]